MVFLNRPADFHVVADADSIRTIRKENEDTIRCISLRVAVLLLEIETLGRETFEIGIHHPGSTHELIGVRRDTPMSLDGTYRHEIRSVAGGS